LEYDPVTFESECTAIQIPDGLTMLVSQGTEGILMQILGGNFTVRLATGYLVRVNGEDAEAIGRERIVTEDPTDNGGEVTEEVVWARLKTCYDPEIPINIVELGLIYSCAIADDAKGTKKVDIAMTLTAPGCGMGQILVNDVESAVSSLIGVSEAFVDLTFEPPWEPSRMSEVARLELGFE
jgi:probable FeS assembly SUF system protein SufT